LGEKKKDDEKSKKNSKKSKSTSKIAKLCSEAEFPYLNRELSWMDFNSRVLEEAFEKENPVLERVKFLSITESNLDEFFMVRVAGVMDRMHSKPNDKDASGMTPVQQFEKLTQKIREFVKKTVLVPSPFNYSCTQKMQAQISENKRFEQITETNNR